MGKRREFVNDKIELCRNCQGTGKVETKPVLGRARMETCPECRGLGMMKKHIEGVVVVEPYDPRAAE